MYGTVVETFGTEDRSFVCECPVCKTDHVIKPGKKDPSDVLITTEVVDVDGIMADGKYVATYNKVDVSFHIKCKNCGVSFNSVVRTDFLAHAITEKKD